MLTRGVVLKLWVLDIEFVFVLCLYFECVNLGLDIEFCVCAVLVF